MSRRPGRAPAKVLVVCYVALAVIMGLSLVATRVGGIPFSVLTRDVFSIGRLPVYSGLLSNLGAFLWCSAAAVCLFAWLVSPREDGFLLATAGLSAVLMVDDFWMVHEWIAPRLLGVREEAVLGAYGTLFIVYMIHYRDRIRGTAPGLFLVATAFFLVDIGLDLIEPVPPTELHYSLEDGLKLFAIGTWLAFAASASAAILRRGAGPEAAD